MKRDYYDFMAAAIAEAQLAAAAGDVPVGAVAVKDGEIIAAAHNCKEAANDPTAHAEILALRAAAAAVNSWRLSDVTLCVTLEPCPMCMGAILQARVATLVFGAWEPKWGACGSKLYLPQEGRFNHDIEIIGGIKERECAALTENFFRQKRNEPL